MSTPICRLHRRRAVLELEAPVPLTRPPGDAPRCIRALVARMNDFWGDAEDER